MSSLTIDTLPPRPEGDRARRVHGGDRGALASAAGVPLERLLDLSANINPLGPPSWFRQELEAGISDLVHYPDPSSRALREALARRWRVPAETLIVGNGSSELLAHLPAAWPARRVLLPVPCYGEYRDAFSGAKLVEMPLDEGSGFACSAEACAEVALARGCELVILGSPSNPAGALLDTVALQQVAEAHPHLRWLLDEAFIELTCGASLLPSRPPNVAVLRSFTKSHACPGLRLGVLAAEPDVAASLQRHLPPWSVNTLAQRFGARAAVEDDDYLEASRAAIASARSTLMAELRALGATVLEGQANYLLFRFGERDGVELARRVLLGHAVAVRSCADYPGLDRRWLRTAVRDGAAHERLCSALASELRQPRVSVQRAPRARALMLLGTSSSAGKSVLTAALCRIFLQDGFGVCPFKAQNMSNNSGVTQDGLEMGRAQVLQAQAARLEPDVRMNPVLLKPNSDTGSQVVVLGRPIGVAAARPYMAEVREKLRATVRQAYDELARHYEVMVLEGAGSPGEVNLKRGDLVNMAMARYAEAGVVLVGDIDRGGVYASFVGHMAVFDEVERALVGGFIVNRFRGDASLLADAHDYMLRHVGKPVIGVVPYRADLGLPEEDAVALEDWRDPQREAPLEIALIHLEHASNFTDIDPLRLEPDVSVRLVKKRHELGSPDAVIIPGSKNTLGDLHGLRQRGLAEAIENLANDQMAEVVGICGGLQILGEELDDPEGIESRRGAASGLGLLPVKTRLGSEKILERCRATHLPSQLPVRGYEIHHGVTAMPERLVVFRRSDGAALGCRSEHGRVWGTYLHGVFDDDVFRRRWLDGLRRAKGLPELGAVQVTYDLDGAIDGLAELVRASCDMAAIRRIAGLA